MPGCATGEAGVDHHSYALTDRQRDGGGSDIDLAVAGIPPSQFQRACTSVETLATDFRIDLVDLEREAGA